MRLNSPALTVLAALLILPLCATAQSYWPLSFSGTSTGTNGAGRLTTQRMTDQTLIQQCAQKSGITDTTGLALVLRFDPGAIGDTIEVVNASDPNAFRAQVLKLAFRQSFTNADGTLIKTFAYVYNDESVIFNDPSGHSRGSVVITQSTATGRKSKAKAPLTGTIQFWLGEWLENRPATNVVVCSGTFTSTQPLNVP